MIVLETDQEAIKTPKSDWELDFYSRPILEDNGKKRWELLITTSQNISDLKVFKWEKICPVGEVNSIWLKKALEEAINSARSQGWGPPSKLRCWRKSMRTMIKRAASQLGLEVIASRRTYSLIEWISTREKEIYPKEKGYMKGPLAPPPQELLNDPIPLPEAARGDLWSVDYLPIESMKEANEWPIQFSGLISIPKTQGKDILIPGLRLFSKTRSLALAGCFNALEPVRMVIKGTQLILEAGQEDQWLITDLESETAKELSKSFINSKANAEGLQFIAIQASPEEKNFSGFWMLKDMS